MKLQDRYLSFVLWSDADQLYVGYCPDLFPAGGVCHGATPVEAYEKLSEIIDDTVNTAQEQGIDLPEPKTRVMREVELAG
jgi:predicted RNase H-like HicB family nuclease